LYIDELAELISATDMSSGKTDKCQILQRTVDQVRRAPAAKRFAKRSPSEEEGGREGEREREREKKEGNVIPA